MPDIALPDLGSIGRRGRELADDWRATSERRQKDAANQGRSLTESLPNIDLGQIDLRKADPRNFGKVDLEKLGVSKLDLSKLDLPARAEIAKQIRKASREQWRRAAKELDRAIPRRQRPVWPWAVVGVLGGVTLGWVLASTPTTRSWIEQGLNRIRRAVNAWWAETTSTRTRTDVEMQAYPRETGSAYEADTYAAAIGAERSATGVGSGVPVGPGSTTPASEVPPSGS